MIKNPTLSRLTKFLTWSLASLVGLAATYASTTGVFPMWMFWMFATPAVIASVFSTASFTKPLRYVPPVALTVAVFCLAVLNNAMEI